MARVYHPAYGLRKITIRRFAAYFAAFEALMFFAGYGLDIMALQGVFWLSLVLVPIMVFPWVLQANTSETDQEFESPAIWTAFAIIGFVAFIILMAVGSYELMQGSAGGAIFLLVAGLIVITFSVGVLRSARERSGEWRRMRAAQRMLCPACGARVQHSVGICYSCGAVVFWVPSWMENE